MVLKDTANGTTNEAGAMSEAPRTIFRSDAVRRYGQPQEVITMPHAIAQRTLTRAWISLALLCVVTASLWLVHVPLAVSGEAIVVAEDRGGQHTVRLVAFLPAAALPRIASGQPMLAQFDRGGTWNRQTIAEVEPEAMSPEEAQRRFAPSAQTRLTQPVTVARATLSAPEPVEPGQHVPVQVVVGTQRLIALLPFFDRIVSESSL